MRREAPPGDSDAPKQFQQDNEKLRVSSHYYGNL